MAVGDFNADGALDLAVANDSNNSVSVLLGDRLGSFTRTADVQVGFAPSSVAVGDFNADGAHDLAAANEYDDVVEALAADGTDQALT